MQSFSLFTARSGRVRGISLSLTSAGDERSSSRGRSVAGDGGDGENLGKLAGVV